MVGARSLRVNSHEKLDIFQIKIPESPRQAGIIPDRQVLASRGEGERATGKNPSGCSPRGPLSPLLANILLDTLDKELETRGHKFVRYADDFVILVKSRRAGDRVMEGMKISLTHKLKLK